MQIKRPPARFSEALWYLPALGLGAVSLIVTGDMHDSEMPFFDIRHISIAFAVGFSASVFIALFRSQTTRQRVALRGQIDSEERFRNLIENSIQGILVQRDQKALFVNQVFAEIFGYATREEVLELPSLEPLVAPGDREKMTGFRKARMEGREAPSRYVGQGVRADGRKIWLETIVSKVMWDDEPALQVAVVDITEATQAEERIRESSEMERRANKLLRDAVESLPMSFALYDANDQLVLRNSKTLDMFPELESVFNEGAGLEEIIRQSVEKNLIKIPNEDKEAYIRQRVRDHRENLGVMEQEREDGRWVAGYASPTSDGGFVSIRMDISERKRAEEALLSSREMERQAHRRLMDAIESLPLSFTLYDSDDKIILCNSRVRNMFPEHAAILKPGTSFEEIVRLSIDQKLVEVPEEGIEALVQKRLQEHRSCPKIVEHEWTDGRWFTIYSRPTSEGGIVSIRMDTTERKRAEQALRESEGRYRDLVEGSILGVIVHRDQPLFVNKAASNIFGYDSPDEMLQLADIEEIFALELRPEILQKRQARYWGEDVLNHYNFKGVRKDGSTIFVETFVQVVNWQGKQAIQCTYNDITNQVQAEEKLHSSQRLLRTVIDTIPHWVFVKGVDGRYLMGNRAFANDYNLEVDDLVGLRLDDLGLNVTEEQEIFHETDRNVLRKGEAVEIPVHRLTLPNGKRQFRRLYKMPLKDSEGKVAGIVALSEDITENRAVEDQLRQSQKMEAVGQLAGGVAHDFNNMLQVIQGSAERALSGMSGEKKGDIRVDLDRILHASQSSARLTSQLLAFSRKQVLSLENLDVNNVIENVMRMINRLIGENVDLKILPGGCLDSIKGDRGMLEQVLMNLCVNARDAMQNGGKLIIETKNIAANEAFCETQKLGQIGNYVLITISDTGKGIPAETQKRIFEPFFTTKERGDGTGLGLSVVYGIIEQHSGCINVTSELAVGTTFSIYLPVASDNSVAAGKPKQQAVTGGKEAVLVAEDEPAVLELVVDMLESMGYTVFAATDGAEACRVFDKHSDSIDLAVLDVIMPGMSGKVVYDHIQEVNPFLPVLFSTGYTSQVIDEDFLANSETRILQKPFSPTALFQAVREALDQAEIASNGRP